MTPLEFVLSAFGVSIIAGGLGSLLGLGGGIIVVPALTLLVRRGGIGIVAAAGTGLQEVSCLISNAGEGISQAIGTGGRDVKLEVGGLMFVAALNALAKDDQTRVILLVSKPPHPEVLARIEKAVKGIRKPVVRCFIGAKTGDSDSKPATLESAAFQAVALARGDKPQKALQHLADREEELHRLAKSCAAKRKPGQKCLRGLFSGGTFCAEAQVILRGSLPGLFSNVPIGGVKLLRNSLVSRQNTLIDFGEDEFTVGRPHPMIDFSLRNRRIVQEAASTETAVILLDVVLGYGSNPDPAGELAGVLRKATRRVAVICSVTGTDLDPQNRSRVEAALRRLGALVMPSNAAACVLAGQIVSRLGKGGA